MASNWNLEIIPAATIVWRRDRAKRGMLRLSPGVVAPRVMRLWSKGHKGYVELILTDQSRNARQSQAAQALAGFCQLF